MAKHQNSEDYQSRRQSDFNTSFKSKESGSRKASLLKNKINIDPKLRKASVDLYQTMKNIPLGLVAMREAIITVDFRNEFKKRGISEEDLQAFQEKELVRRSTFRQKRMSRKQGSFKLRQTERDQMEELKARLQKMMEDEEEVC